ncbi:MAG: hypothetical protein HY521_06895 [Proteobacteria bacterium]|nr:hypothetical protein [Pseudomonadota bacterium]
MTAATALVRLAGHRAHGAAAAEVVADARFQHAVRRLYARGPRLIGELLAAIGAERSCMTAIEAGIDRLLAIPDEALDLTGGRDLPPRPLHVVEGGG